MYHRLEISDPSLIGCLTEAYQASFVRTEARPFRRRSVEAHRPIGRWALDTRAAFARSAIVKPVARGLAGVLERLSVKQIAGHGYGAFFIVGAVVQAGQSLTSGLIRHSRKDHGFMELVEGGLNKTDPVFILDDILNSGNSVVQAASLLRQEGFRAAGAVVVFEYGWADGAKMLGRFGLAKESLATLHRPDEG